MDGISHVSVSTKELQFLEAIRTDKSSRFGIGFVMLVTNMEELEKTGTFRDIEFAGNVMQPKVERGEPDYCAGYGGNSFTSSVMVP